MAMMLHNVFYLAMALQFTFVHCGVVPKKREMIKPGHCRNVAAEIKTEECVDSCVYDSHCPGLTKCCRVGCGLRCVGGGFFLRLPSESEEKSQLCPPEKMFAKRPCESRSVFCRSHSDCTSDDGICCNDGCDTKCIPRGSLLTPEGVCRSTGWIFHPGEMFQKPGCLLCICFSARRQKCHHLRECGIDAEHQEAMLQNGLETETDSIVNEVHGVNGNDTSPFGSGIKENYIGLDSILQSEEDTFARFNESNGTTMAPSSPSTSDGGFVGGSTVTLNAASSPHSIAANSSTSRSP